MKQTCRLAVLLCVSLLAANAAGPSARHVDFKDTVLKNGLRVITVEDHNSPVAALAVIYNVGSRNEKKGRTGFAHLFEHMMFKGSENVGSGEHSLLITYNGGGLNGSTNQDETNYYEVVPANQLEMVLFLESDRMRSLAITQDGLDNQRNAVQEERRQRVDNQPYGRTDEVHQELLYDNFAYKHSVIGSMEDLNAATVDDVRAFFKLYYAPNNAVLALVGDFNQSDALARIRKYFEAIPRQPDPPPVDMAEPEQTAERRATVDDKLARLPQVDIAFKAVPGNTSDFYALEVLSSVLQGGQSSRLYQSLVKEKEMAQGVRGYMTEMRGPGAFYTTVTLRPDKKTDDAEAAVYAEIERLKKEPVADWELEKGRNATRRALIARTQTCLLQAYDLGHNAIFYNDPTLINTRADKVAAVTKDDVQRVANKYLKQTNRTVVITVPKAPMAAAGR